MTDNEIFEAVKQRFTDPKVMDLLRNGLADPEEMEVVKRALRYGDAAMTIPSLRSILYKVFDRLLNVVKDDSTTRQMVKQDLRQLQKGDSDMSEDLNTANVAKAVAHDCAKHVVHETWGKGQCIAGEHTLLEDGTVTHYDVMFEHGIEQDVPVADLTVVVSESHMHASKKKKAAMEEEAVTPAGGEDSSKASKKGKPEMPLEKLKAIMEKKKSKAYLAMLKSQGKMEEETEIEEKTLTKAEMKKREEVAKAIERDQPEMPMGKKMAIATATAKKVAEAKAHTVPKTAKEKSLAALAAPHDKITHADVMVGRGVGKKKTMKEFVEQLAESLSPKALGDHLEKHTRVSPTDEVNYWEGPMKHGDQHPADKARLDRHIPAAKEPGSYVYRVDGGNELMVHHKGGITALSGKNKVTHFSHSEEGKKQLDAHLKKMRMKPDSEN